MLLLRCGFAVTAVLLAVILKPAIGYYSRAFEIHCKEDGSAAANDTTTDTLSDQDGGCTLANCSCHSLSVAVNRYLISNTVINITTDVTLSSVTLSKNLDNILIVGYNNPTVRCIDHDKGGGLQFLYCNDCIIEGIVWDNCGYRTIHDQIGTPVIKFYESSNVKIQNCVFRNSLGQGISLIAIRDVVIDHCIFVNNLYKYYGAAIVHFTPEVPGYNLSHTLLISNCNFTDTEDALSVVHVDPSVAYLTLKNSVFQRNKGSPVHIVNQDLNINGTVIFEENLATNGGGIYVEDYSIVRFCKDSTVTFKNNRANFLSGGAIYMQNHSNILFDQGSRVSFLNNKAVQGGAIYSRYNCYIFSEEKAIVDFVGNLATPYGGAVYLSNVSIVFKSSNITFTNNSANQYGGAIYFQECCNDLIVKRKSVVTFDSNTAENGGATYCEYYTDFKFQDNSIVSFSNNFANLKKGGAMFHMADCNMYFEQSSVVTFVNNSAVEDGGAISMSGSSITFKDHSQVNFSDNSALLGGAIVLDNSNITFDDKASVTFNKNSADSYGGSLYVDTINRITFKGYSVVTFQDNKAKKSGGAIYFIGEFVWIICTENSVLEFNGNSVQNAGGALVCVDNSKLIVDENSSVIVSNNTATYGGTIVAYQGCNLVFNPLRTELILILRFSHISNHTLVSNASLHHWLQH